MHGRYPEKDSRRVDPAGFYDLVRSKLRHKYQVGHSWASIIGKGQRKWDESETHGRLGTSRLRAQGKSLTHNWRVAVLAMLMDDVHE